MADQANGADSDSLFEFPCDFPIKIMGVRSDDFAQEVIAIVLRHAPDFDAASAQMRPSSKGSYLGVTCVFRAHSRAQVDALYLELTAHPQVKVVL